MTERVGLWEALQRRKVFRATGIYLAAAWVLLQFAGLLASAWEAPPWFLQGVFILLLLGLPVVAVISWLYDFTDGGLTETPGRGFVDLVWRRGWRARLRVAGGGVGIALLTLVLFAYFWPDQGLSPDARRLMANAGGRDTDPRTLGYGLYGLKAPAGRDIWQHGRFLISTYNLTGSVPTVAEPELRATVQQKDLCPLDEAGCFEAQVRGAEGLRVLIAANSELVARYLALRGAVAFDQVIGHGYDAPFPDYSTHAVARRLYHRAVLLDHLAGRHAQADAALATDVAFLRQMFAESRDILVKMVASRSIYETVLLQFEFARRAVARGERPGPAPARLSITERSMVAAMAYEASAMLEHGLDPNRMSPLLPFKRNATINHAIRLPMDAARASLLSPREFQAYSASYQVPRISATDWVLNFPGALVLREMPDYHPYLARCHDLDVFLVLMQVAWRALEEGVSADALPTWLLALPPELRNPYDGSPPLWKDGKLSFPSPDGHDTRTPTEVSLNLGTV